MTRNRQTLTIETVSHVHLARGIVTRHNVAVRDIPTAYRVGRRATHAYRVGLEYVRALGDTLPETHVVDGEATAYGWQGVSYVAVLDSQRRVLAAWRRMDRMGGFTGTHDRHPMVGGRSMFYRR